MSGPRTYLVERSVPASKLTALAEALARANFASRRVVHMGSLSIAGDESCLCAFQAPSRRAVAIANDALGLEFERVVEVALISGAWCGGASKTPFFHTRTMRGDD
jgi:hypothetical protein